LGGILGTGFGVALGFFFFPFVFPPPPAAEQLTAADRTTLVATGTFIHANPSDPIHYGKGKVSVYERAVFLEPDFEVGPGPGVPCLSGAEGEHSRCDCGQGFHVYRSRWIACVQGQPALSNPTRRQSEELSQRGDLVRAIFRADLASGFDTGKVAR
jgi:hypothetical protein